jgi:hypothetical protein
MKLFSRVLIAALMIALLFSATASASLTIGDANYVGNVINGAPASPANEVSYINTLITLAAGAANSAIGGQTYNRLSSTHLGPFATAVTTDTIRDDTGNNMIDLGSMTYQYVLAKDGNIGSFVWFSAAGFTGMVEVPSDLNGAAKGGGLSHVSFYNKGEGVIPEPGTMLIWLVGLAAAAAGTVFLRRRSG